MLLAAKYIKLFHAILRFKLFHNKYKNDWVLKNMWRVTHKIYFDIYCNFVGTFKNVQNLSWSFDVFSNSYIIRAIYLFPTFWIFFTYRTTYSLRESQDLFV